MILVSIRELIENCIISCGINLMTFKVIGKIFILKVSVKKLMQCHCPIVLSLKKFTVFPGPRAALISFLNFVEEEVITFVFTLERFYFGFLAKHRKKHVVVIVHFLCTHLVAHYALSNIKYKRTSNAKGSDVFRLT